MGNLNEAHKKQINDVLERQRRVEEACNNLKSKGIKITYESVSDETAIVEENSRIPAKTLEGKYYRSIIDKYREDSNQLVNDNQRYMEEIKYLNKVISSLREQNKELCTKLYSNKMI